jgi:hypothetical protein
MSASACIDITVDTLKIARSEFDVESKSPSLRVLHEPKRREKPQTST